MIKLPKKTLLILLLTDAALALAFTCLLVLWLRQVEVASPVFFGSLYIALFTSAVVLSFLPLRFARELEFCPTIKRIEHALSARERALSEHTIVCVMDLDGVITWVNQNFTETFEYTADEIVGEHVETLLSGQGKPYERVFKTINAGEVWSGSQDLRAKSGKIIRLQTNIMPRFDDAGTVCDTITIGTDVSTALAEGAVAGRNAFVEVLPDEVYICDADSFRVKYLNEKARARLNVSRENVGGIRLLDLFSQSELVEYRRHIAPLLSGQEKVVRIELDHSTGPVEVLTQMNEEPGVGRTLVSVVRDTTARREAEQLKLSSVTTVSHELRTPLTSIRGALRVLESGVLGGMSEDAERMVAMASRNCDRLGTIVNDILTLQRLSSGELTIDSQTIDLREVLDEAVQANAPYAAECGVEFSLEPSGWPAMACVDSARMMQVMANLLSNAAKFSKESSTVFIRLRDCDTDWRIEVQDFGPGIPEDAQATIYDSFTQARNVGDKGKPGTGLGLTICKKIIEQHGGIIGFESDQERGTTFYVELKKDIAHCDALHIA